MTDLTTRAREMCEGGKVDPQIVRTVYELCEALEQEHVEVERLSKKYDVCPEPCGLVKYYIDKYGLPENMKENS